MTQKYENKDLILKTIRFDPKTVATIQEMADESERNFTEQVRFIIKEYIRLKEQLNK